MPFDLTQPNLGLAVNSPINLLTPPSAPAAQANAPKKNDDKKRKRAGVEDDDDTDCEA